MFLKGKKALITGLPNDRSIAYGITEAFVKQGAEVAFTYQIEKFKGKIEELCVGLGVANPIIIPCDGASDESIANCKQELKKHWDKVDIIIHSMAFADKTMLSGDYMTNLTREGFRLAHDVSVYSFTAFAKEFLDMIPEGGALLTLSYLGAEKYVPNYNVMGLAKASLEASVKYLAVDLGKKGIRVNAISAGPIKTFAASGIKDFNKMLDYASKRAPLKRGVSVLEVGNATAFLCSDLASGITGEITYVDGGFNITAMGADEVE